MHEHAILPEILHHRDRSSPKSLILPASGIMPI